MVDRGHNGVELLNYIRSQKTMVMLMGNHEHMLLRYYSPDVTDAEIRRWDRNRNTPTKEGLLRLSEQERQSLFEWIAALPTHMEVQVAGKKYYLVHGFPGENLYNEVWGRTEPIKNFRFIRLRADSELSEAFRVGKSQEMEWHSTF